jgi:hypothetical protein
VNVLYTFQHTLLPGATAYSISIEHNNKKRDMGLLCIIGSGRNLRISRLKLTQCRRPKKGKI